jgi:ferric iron reductase protein FhuF
VSTPAGLTPVTGPEVAAALHRAGGGNPLLTLDTSPPGQGGAGPDSAVSPAGSVGGDAGLGGAADALDRAAAAALIDAVGTWLGAPQRRVAASLVVLGYSARLVGPAVAVWLTEDLVPDLRAGRVRYAYLAGRGFHLSLPEPAGWRGSAGSARDRWSADVIDGHLRLVIDAVRSAVPVAAGLLWGNVASGLAGALRMLALTGRVPVDRCHAEGQALLAYGPLAGSGALDVHKGQLTFRRRSCCLFYRIEGGGTCGDCPLDR